MDPDGGNQTNLTTNGAFDGSPAWSPDGTKIAFVSGRDGNNEVYVMGADGTNPTRLTDNTVSDGSPAWSPDGTKIAFDRVGEIFFMNAADGTDEVQLTFNVAMTFPSDFAPAWSPDGMVIAFSRSLSNVIQEICSINADGTGTVLCTNNVQITRFPNWSPDGTSIAFDRGPAGSAFIYVMDPDFSNQTKITSGLIDQEPAWSPDGTKIAFTRFNLTGTVPSDIYVMDDDGNNQTALTNNPTASGPVRENAPDWQPLPNIAKAITSGPDEDDDSNIDVVVEVGQTSTTEYDFTLTYTNPGGPFVVIEDTVPAEWEVQTVEGTDVTGIGKGPAGGTTVADGENGNVDVFHPGRGNPSKSATRLEWTPDPSESTSDIVVVADTRSSPGGKGRFAPTSCGALILNDGAQVFEADPATGEPLRDQGTGEKLPPLFEADGICLAAVEDLNNGGLVLDGSGDEDGDGFTDLAEACGFGTDPCVFDADADGDNIPDAVDNCPFTANSDQTDEDEDGFGAACDSNDQDPTVQ